MIIDPTTPVGKIRLRIGDFSDLPLLSDDVIVSTLDDCQGNVLRASVTCAQYILAMLSFKTHRKLAQLEIWGSEAFAQYKEFLVLTIKDPAFMSIAPVPIAGGLDTEHPIIKFTRDWNDEYKYLQTYYPQEPFFGTSGLDG